MRERERERERERGVVFWGGGIGGQWTTTARDGDNFN